MPIAEMRITTTNQDLFNSIKDFQDDSDYPAVKGHNIPFFTG